MTAEGDCGRVKSHGKGISKPGDEKDLETCWSFTRIQGLLSFGCHVSAVGRKPLVLTEILASSHFMRITRVRKLCVGFLLLVSTLRGKKTFLNLTPTYVASVTGKNLCEAAVRLESFALTKTF
jgi:hypothetical protein